MFNFGMAKKQSAGEMFSSNEVAAAARITLRQLQWWDERKLVVPEREGHSRMYTQGELMQMVLLAALRRRGLSLQSIRTYLRKLQRDMARQPDEQYFVIANHKSAEVCGDSSSVIDLMKKSNTSWVVVSMSHELRQNARAAAIG